MTEELERNWRKVPGYENYEIAVNVGECKCRSLNYKRTGRMKELSNKTNPSNRIIWCLANKDGAKYEQAAVWVALTFPELVSNEWFEGAQIDHIDTDPLNNHPTNLRWTTIKGNANNPITSLNRKKAAKSSEVVQLNLNGEVLKTYKSIMEAQRETGVDNSNIGQCCRGKRNTAGGFKWMYE